MKKLNIVLTIMGLAGMIIMSLLAIVESESGKLGSLVSAIPACILFASLFIAGYVSLEKK